MSNSRNEKLKELFKTHPKTGKFFITSDDQAFFEENHANAHSKTLEDKEVVKVSRSLFEQAEKVKADAEAKAQKDAGKAAKKAEADAKKAAKEPKAPAETGTADKQPEAGVVENKPETANA